MNLDLLHAIHANLLSPAVLFFALKRPRRALPLEERHRADVADGNDIRLRCADENLVVIERDETAIPITGFVARIEKLRRVAPPGSFVLTV